MSRAATPQWTLDELTARVTREIAIPFANGLAQDECPYTGWLVFDVVRNRNDIIVRDVATFPDLEFVSSLAGADHCDLLRLITFVMSSFDADVVSNNVRKLKAMVA